MLAEKHKQMYHNFNARYILHNKILSLKCSSRNKSTYYDEAETDITTLRRLLFVILGRFRRFFFIKYVKFCKYVLTYV